MPERESRNYDRYGLELPVQVRWKDSLGNAREETGTTRDMSRSGTYIICNSSIDEGCEVYLEIDLTICAGARIKSCVSVGGKVIRAIPLTGPDRGYGHAIIFDEYRFMRS